MEIIAYITTFIAMTVLGAIAALVMGLPSGAVIFCAFFTGVLSVILLVAHVTGSRK